MHETIRVYILSRYATTWMNENGTLARQLIKAYGIRINILVTGQVCIINILRYTDNFIHISITREENFHLQI